jgi:catechol 2,3-dioxygenase-like lactoylglutathione lyase family enzyme
MENTIASLLQDSETGKMDRRQLIQGLALTATTAFCASATATAVSAPAAGKGFRAVAYNHISYNVADVARIRDFYVDLYGMKVAWDDGKQCSLECGNPPDALYLRKLKQPGDRANVDHLAFSIANFNKDAVEAELKRRGLDVKDDGPKAWSTKDPDGLTIQICAIRGVFPGAAAPRAKESDGTKNLKAIPGPNNKSFKAIAVSHLALHVPDIPKSRDFYSDLLGMKAIYYKPEEPNSECFLRFGNDAFYLRKSDRPDHRPYVNHFAFMVANYNQDAVEAELKRRGLDPKPDSKLAWTIHDPEGMRIEVCGKGLPEHIANDCHGANPTCPGGPRG